MTAPRARAPIAACPRCLAEPPGRILTMAGRGWHHLCGPDLWRAHTESDGVAQVEGRRPPGGWPCSAMQGGISASCRCGVCLFGDPLGEATAAAAALGASARTRRLLYRVLVAMAVLVALALGALAAELVAWL